MSTPPNHRAARRTEARRRSRMAARGEPSEEEAEPTEADDQPRASFLGRLFPPAPPLPNKPPPLAGFDESGPLRPIRVRVFLLMRNPAAWLLTGLVAAAGYFASLFFPPTTIVAFIGTLVRFGALIGAGWFGWQRPALFGTASAVISYVLVVGILFVLSSMASAASDTFGAPGQIASRLGLEAVYQGALGFLGGWYGGYLRRRQTQLSADRARLSRRR